MKNIVLSISPLTNHFKDKISKIIGLNFVFLTLSDLKKTGIRKSLISLLRMRADYFLIAVEDAESLSLLPALNLSSIFVRANKKYFLDFEFKLKKITLIDQFVSLASFSFFSIYNVLYKEFCRINFYKLQKNKKEKNNVCLPKKILYINANLWYGVKVGGSIGHVAGVINGFCDMGCSVIYAAVNKNPMIHSVVKTYLFQSLKSGFPPELNHYRFSGQTVKELEKIILADKPDLIYQRLSFANDAGVVLSRKFKIPLIMEYNGSEVWCAEQWGRPLLYPKLALLAEKICLKHADRVVTISEVLKKQLIDANIEKEKIVCYPNGVDPEIFNPKRFSEKDKLSLRQKYHLTSKALVFTFVGTFGLWHGVDLLAKAIVELVKNQKNFLDQYDIKFMWVGDGIQSKLVREILEQGNAMDYCVFAGLIMQEDAPHYLAASDIFLAPNVHNPDGTPFFGSPTKLFEYMAMEKPIIASDLGQIGEILNESIRICDKMDNLESDKDFSKKMGILFKPGELDSLINAIVFISERPELRSHIGRNARNEVMEKYTWHHHVEKILNPNHVI